jgi:hypothetical protein
VAVVVVVGTPLGTTTVLTVLLLAVVPQTSHRNVPPQRRKRRKAPRPQLRKAPRKRHRKNRYCLQREPQSLHGPLLVPLAVLELEMRSKRFQASLGVDVVQQPT